MPLATALMKKRLRNKQDLLFKKPDKKIRKLKNQAQVKVTLIQISFTNSNERYLSGLNEFFTHLLRKIDAVDTYRLFGPDLQVSQFANIDLWTSSLEMGLLFAKKISTANTIVESLLKSHKAPLWKDRSETILTKEPSMIERFTDAFLESFNEGVSSASLGNIESRIYTSHFIKSKPDMSDFRRLKRLQSIISGATDLEFKAASKALKTEANVNQGNLFTSPEPQLKIHQSDFKERLRSPKSKHHHEVQIQSQHTPRGPKPIRMAPQCSSVRELRAVMSTLSIQNRSFQKLLSPSFTKLYQEAKSKRKRLGLDKVQGVSLKIQRDYASPRSMAGSFESSKTIEMPSIRSLNRRQ